MKRFTYVVATAALSSIGVLGCDKDETRNTSSTGTGYTSPSTTSPAPAVDVDVDINKDKMKNMAGRTGDALERGAERTGEVAREAGRDTRDALQTAGQKISNAANRTRDNVKVDVDANSGTDTAQPAGARGTVAPDGTAAAPDAEGIRDVLAQVAEASLTKGGLDDLVERLVDEDRNRIGQTLQDNNTELDGRIEQFRKDWKAKYNQDFDIQNEEQAFPNQAFMIAQGEIGQNAAAAPADPDANRNDPGRNVATVKVQASHGLPALTVPMIHEAPDSWRIDVPNTLTAEKLKANVLAQLTMANEMKDQWPADVNQAHAAVTHHVLMALLDQPVQQR